MDKYDKLLECISSNQEIPGQLGNNFGGVTNLDLTGEEELVMSGLYDDAWDESSSSGFEDLPMTDEDIQLECIFESKLFEHRGKPDPKKAKERNNKNISKEAGLNKNLVNKKYDTKAAKINAKMDRKRAKLDYKNDNASEKMAEKNAAYKYHKEAGKNSTGLEKAWHKLNTRFSGGAINKKIQKLQEKRKKKLNKNQEKRKKALSESDIQLECLYESSKLNEGIFGSKRNRMAKKTAKAQYKLKKYDNDTKYKKAKKAAKADRNAANKIAKAQYKAKYKSLKRMNQSTQLDESLTDKLLDKAVKSYVGV